MKGRPKGDGRRIIPCKWRGREATWLKQKDTKSAGSFGEIFPLRIDNSESNKNEVLDIIDDDQDDLVEG